VIYVYQLREAAQNPIRPKGLDAGRRYRVREIGLPEGTRSRLELHDKVVEGASLLERGFTSPLRRPLESAVVLLTAER
jgi:hypothetical protein